MKTRLLIAVLLCWSCASFAQDGDQLPDNYPASAAPNSVSETDKANTKTENSVAPREGDSIWLEEKIAPPTRWVEGLVRPLTSWMERKVQRHDPIAEPGPARPATRPNVAPLASDDPLNGNRITSQDAAAAAKLHAPGDVLRVKLLENETSVPVYRVKLISKVGEIHILHIDARSGSIIEPDAPPPAVQQSE